MNKIAIFFVLIAAVLACGPSDEQIQLQQGIDEYIEIIKCFLGKTELISDITSVIEVIKSGDYSKLLPLAIQVYTHVTAAVKDCLVPKEVSLEGTTTPACLLACQKLTNSIVRDACKAACVFAP